MALIAGHLFGYDDRCSCGRKWLDIMHIDETYVGDAGYSHTGSLNATEVDQIQNERNRRCRIFEMATYGVAEGSGHTWKSPEPPQFDDVEAE